jgi:hypothetical protein
MSIHSDVDGGEVGGATSVGDSNVWLGKITDEGPMVIM